MFPVERVPEKIGAYSVVKYVGRSGMADVYVARMDGPLDFQRMVSLKIVRFALEDDARLGEELAREAAICSRLNHPAVMRMYDFFEYERKLVLVLEQAEGASLAKITQSLGRRKQKLGDNAILYIAVELASALAHAHAAIDEDGNAAPVIHRNVNPENVLVSWDGRVKLAGFGLGKILGQTPDSVAGTVTGTPGFMAPEQARGERSTVRSDVYALGALLWSLFADAEPPGDGQRPVSISTLRPDIPREIAAAIEASLELSPDKRRISCHELAQWASKMTNAEKGREELRQKALSLRSARDTVDAPRAAPRPVKQRTRRRAAVSQARQSLRRSALVASSYPAPPSSRAARLESRNPDLGDSDPPTSQRGAIRIPPPPPLPKDRYEAERAALRARGSEPAPGRGGSEPAPRSRSSPAYARSGSEPARRGSEPVPYRRGSEPAAPRRGSEPVPYTARTGSAAPGMRPATDTALTIRPVSVIPPPSSRPRSFRPQALAGSAPAPSPFDDQETPSFGDAANGAELASNELADEPTSDLKSTRPDGIAVQTHPNGIPVAPRFGPPPPTGQPQTFDGTTGTASAVADDAQPYRIRRIEAARRSRQSVIVTMSAAALVVAIGALVLQWKSPAASSAQPAQTTKDRPADPPPTPVQQPPPPVVVTSPPPVETAKASEPDTANLSPDMGYITVKTPDAYDVYINGQRVGATNAPAIAPCGQRFMRLATMKNDEVAYVGRGQTVLIQCKGTTVATGDLTPVLPRGFNRNPL